MFDHTLRLSRRMVLVIAGCAILSFDAMVNNWQDHPCYADAQIGYDSVINARLGMPVEQALDIADYSRGPLPERPRYSTELLNLILTAYLWDASPHEYSRAVFYNCTVSNRPLVSTDLVSG